MRLVIAAAALALAAGPAASQVAAPAPPVLAPGETLLEVEAIGRHQSRPDVMRLSAGAVTTGRTARTALEANDALADRMIQAVRALGIAPTDVRTRELQVSPRFEESDEARAERDGREPRIIGYVARNVVELRLRELGRASDLIDALVAAGANSIEGPYFSLDNDREALRLARRAAIAEAREQAEQYADAAGMRIARTLRIGERGPTGGRGRQDSIIVTGSRIGGTPIEPGEISSDVTVWVDYALVPR